MTQVYNPDVVGVVRRVNRFIQEALKSSSSAVSLTNAYDIARLESYLNAIEQYVAWMKGQPQLDLPETHPQMYDVPDAPGAAVLENEDLNDIVNLWNKMRDELINSQSARQPSGLISHDVTRFDLILAKMKAFLVFIKNTSPLDVPESSPMAEMSGSGMGGV